MSARFVWQMATREARAARRRLLLLTASVTAGTGALVAVNSFADNLTASVAAQAQALLGADLSFRGRTPLDSSARATTILDSLRTALGDRVAIARSSSFTAMAYLDRSGGTRLVQVRSVDAGWPYYGAIETAPAGTWPLLQQGTVIVDPSLLAALDARVGDTLVLGEARYPIAATVVNVPGDVGLQEAFGARVFIATSTVPSTGLLGFGARVTHEAFVRLPSDVDAQSLARGCVRRCAASASTFAPWRTIAMTSPTASPASPITSGSWHSRHCSSAGSASRAPCRSSSGSGWTASPCSVVWVPPRARSSRST